MRLKLVLILSLAVSVLAGCSLPSLPFSGEETGLERGMRLIGEGSYDEALLCFDEAESHGEDRELVNRGRGIARMGLSDYDGAIKNFKTALGESSGYVSDLEFDISFYLAVAEYRNGDVDAAIDTYKAILDLRPKNADAWFLKGKAELSKDDVSEAVSNFHTSVQYDSENPDRFISIYECMSDAGYAEEGRVFLDAALAVKKITDFQKGKLYYWQGDYENAKVQLEKARGNGQDPDLVLYLGRTYEALGDTSYAASLYKTYLKDNSGNALICNQLGLCELENKNYQDALSAFEQGLAAHDSNLEQSLLFNQIAAYELSLIHI